MIAQQIHIRIRIRWILHTTSHRCRYWLAPLYP